MATHKEFPGMEESTRFIVAINFASKEELAMIPGVSDKLATILFSIREAGGNITPEILSAVCRKHFTGEELGNIDFSLKEKVEKSLFNEGTSVDEVSERDISADRSFKSMSEFSGSDHSETSELKIADIKADEPIGTSGTLQDPVVRPKEFMPTGTSGNVNDPVVRPKEFMPNMQRGTLGYSMVDFSTPKFPRSIPSGYRQFMSSASDVDITETPVKHNTPYQAGGYRQFVPSKSTAGVLTPDVKFNMPSMVGGYDQDYGTPLRSKLPASALPRNITFDGRGSWEAFHLKFSHFAERCQWSSDDKFDALCWALEGKALDYYVILHKNGEGRSYMSLCNKLEARFGEQILPGAAQAQFHQTNQNPGESIDDFVDRLLSLAGQAFSGLRESFVIDQVMNRFCYGLLDKDAGHYVYMHNPESIQQAKLIVRKYQQSYQALYGKSKRDKRREEERVSAVRTDKRISHTPKDNSLNMDTVMSAIKNLENRFDKLDKKITVDQKTTVPGEKPKSKKRFKCYGCGKYGHFKRDCPQDKAPIQERLNQEGSGKSVAPRS
jgi:hypothetical protein